MLDFNPVREKRNSLAELAAGLTVNDLRDLSNEMVDAMLDLIAECTDEDVVFVPQDPDAHDPYASDSTDEKLPWTLGHVIVHATASSEEAAFLAAELARGVHHHGRSRYEVPWETVRTIEQCRQRLEESRRMRLASLGWWPDEPQLENSYQPRPNMEPFNAVSRFLYGLMHDDSHLDQIQKIVRQAKEARLERA